MRRFEGRVVLVTGAGRGIGAAIADHFLAEGARVHRGDLQGGDMKLDVRDRKSVAEAMAAIRAKHGGLDVLVNNAGLICTGGPAETSGEEWDNLVATNLTGLFNCIQAALPLMEGRAGASIVNLASVSAEKGGGAIGNVWYGTTKAGVVALTKGLGRELGPKGIRINAISPAVVDTAMTHDMLATGLGQKAIARIPLGRLAERSDVARAALFLASDDAGFITGETIAVDGGFLRT
ncbi:MAG TPA: SDR family NAD(P)-dependent oxidoreductase [Usitatibacter sp.]|jgi:3-oxoacyl-[acyl-carrier protein] reductase|nr:SDR family NAD(P)-dependent oxidoreductase [Usitatibacter sp.]